MQGKPSTSSKVAREGGKVNFGDAFGITTSQPMAMEQMTPGVTAEQSGLLEHPYPFAATTTKNGDVK